jgi:hypothetical protein
MAGAARRASVLWERKGDSFKGVCAASACRRCKRRAALCLAALASRRGSRSSSRLHAVWAWRGVASAHDCGSAAHARASEPGVWCPFTARSARSEPIHAQQLHLHSCHTPTQHASLPSRVRPFRRRAAHAARARPGRRARHAAHAAAARARRHLHSRVSHVRARRALTGGHGRLLEHGLRGRAGARLRPARHVQAAAARRKGRRGRGMAGRGLRDRRVLRAQVHPAWY